MLIVENLDSSFSPISLLRLSSLIVHLQLILPQQKDKFFYL
jgi:hypothetical protein